MRRHSTVALPNHVFRVRKPSGLVYFYYQERRGKPDKGPLIRIPFEPRDPQFWQMIEEITRGEVGPAAGTFDALIAHYKGSKRYTVRADNSRELYDICCAKISAAWGRLNVRDLLPKHVYALQDKLGDRPSIANMTVKVLRFLLKEGIKAGYCTVNVAREIELLEEAGIGSEPWPEEVFAYVLEHAPVILMRAAVLGRATGQRAVDLVKMRPADRHENGINMLVKKVGNQRHWVPLMQEALRAVDGWGVEKMVPYLTRGGRRIGEDPLRVLWKDFKGQHPQNIPQDLTLHDLRANAVCDRRLAGIQHQQISDQLYLSIGKVIAYSKHMDKAANAKAGMLTMEQERNATLKTIYAAIENRSS